MKKQVHEQIKHNGNCCKPQKFLRLCILIAACIIDEIPHLRISQFYLHTIQKISNG